ncbi:MAG: cadherin-like domain-containing protein [Planctomycetes bacterium]|nr:cadherin-like domain-containing protein [Planctomycetota bacterium]
MVCRDASSMGWGSSVRRLARPALRIVIASIVLGGTSVEAQVSTFVRGDCNLDAIVGIGDAIAALNHLFAGGSVGCEDACDVDDDGLLTIGDPISLLSFLFGGGSGPAEPFPDCGGDPGADTLSCDASPPCPSGSPPRFTTMPPTDATEGVLFTYAAGATDADVGELLTFELVVAPTGASVDGGTGLVSWIPSFAQQGSHSFVLRVADSIGLLADQPFEVIVANVNQVPVGVADVFGVGAGCTIDGQLLANDSDLDGDELSATLVDAPSFGTVVLDANGIFHYTHDGSAESDVFTYEASDGELGSGPVTVTLTRVDDPYGFVDHFSAPALDPRWLSVASGGGAVVIEPQGLRLSRPLAEDTAFVRSGAPIDLERSQLWMFALRRTAGDDLVDAVALWRRPAGSPPTDAPEAELDAERLASVGLVDSGSVATLRFRYDLTGDSEARHWDGVPFDVWTPPGVVADALDETRVGGDADWTTVGLEIDAVDSRFRFLAWGGVGTTLGDVRQGVRLTALTDWVGFDQFSTLAATDDVWLTIGDRHTEQSSGDLECAWVRLQQGARRDAYTNGRAGLASDYVLRHHLGYGTQFVPEGRGVDALVPGPVGSWHERGNRKKCVFRDDDGIYYLFFEGLDAVDQTSIGLATCDGPDGPWIPHPSNPVVPRTVLPFLGVSYDVLTAPWVIRDLGELDPSKRWKMLVSGELAAGSRHRLFLLTAAQPEGPWTRVDGPDLDGAVLAESLAGDWRDDGVSDPLVWFDPELGEWCLFYSGIREKETEFGPGGWSIGFATSPDLVNWTEASDNPRIAGDPNAIRSWSGFTGRTITISDSAAFREGAAVIVRNASTVDDWAIARIERIDGNDLVLYEQLAGLTGTSSNRTVAQLGAGSLSPMALIREPHGCYRLFVTAFQPFILGAASAGFGNCELVGSLTAPSIAGPWTWDDFGSPAASFDRWGTPRSQENLRVILTPTVR